MSQNKWTQPKQPPPPLFIGAAERNFVKQINDEVIEKVIGQQVLYFPVDIARTKFNLYGEAIDKTFYSPVQVYGLVNYEESERTQGTFGFDNVRRITAHFNDRRISQDKNLFLRLGDFVQYDDTFFEIIDVSYTKTLFGQDSDFADGFGIGRTISGREVRAGLFNPGRPLGQLSRRS
jgi:hypothetical protein